MKSLLFAVPLTLFAVAAHAETDVTPEPPKKVTAEERPFVNLLDPTTPSAGAVSAGYSIGLGSGVSADRPLPSDPTAATASHSVSVGFGATDRVAPFATGVVDGVHGATAIAGVRLQWTDPSARFRFTTAGAFLREGTGAVGGFVRAAASYDVGALRVAGNLHGERLFAAGRDRLDVLALAGVSYRVLPGLRVGAEYVGQDLEDAVEGDEAEGGAKHYVGPSAAIDLDHGRAQLTFGPSFGLFTKTPRVLGRVGLVVSF